MRPAVVLLDVQLPDIDGFDVAAWLTAQADGAAVVLMSSHDGSEFGVRIVLGEDSVLRRQPVTAVIRHALEYRPEGRN